MKNIFQIIHERHSSFGLFYPAKSVSKNDLNMILEAARWAPSAHNMQNFEIIVVDDVNLLDAIGDIKFPVSAAYVRENFESLSFSDAELIKRKTGIIDSGFPKFMKTPGARTYENISNKDMSSVGKQVQTCTVMLVLVYDPAKRAPASEGDFLGIISLGCATENMWLMADSLDISFHIMSSIHSEPIAGEVRKLLKIPDHLTIVFGIRLGYAVPSNKKYLKVRREKEDFIYSNNYGNSAR
jgi:nitroreductase